MPKIPVYQRKMTIPGESGGVIQNINAAGAEWGTLAQGGRAVMQEASEVSNAINSFQAKMDAAKSLTEESNVKAEMYRDSATLGDKLSRVTDPVTGEVKPRTEYETIPQETHDFQAGNIEKYKSMVSTPMTWAKLQPFMVEHQNSEMKNALSIARKLEIDKMKMDWIGNMDTAEEMYVTTGDRSFIDNAIKDTKNMIMAQVVGAEEGMRRADTIGTKADTTRFNNINRSDPDVAEKLLSEKEKNFPFLDAEEEYKAGMKIEQRRKAIEMEKAKEVRQAHNNNAKLAFDRSQLWKKGKKSSDGVPFEEWLDNERSTDKISESTYQMYVNKIERAKDRALTASLNPKWSVADHIKFGQVEAQFLDPNNDLGWDDIASMTKGLPVSAAGKLSEIMARQPSKERKQLMSTQWKFIEKKLKESEAEPETWEQTRTTWDSRLKDTKDADISKLAKELTAELPEDSMTQMIKQSELNKAQQPGIFQRMFGGKTQPQGKTQPAAPAKPVEKKKMKFNAVTGEIE